MKAKGKFHVPFVIPIAQKKGGLIADVVIPIL